MPTNYTCSIGAELKYSLDLKLIIVYHLLLNILAIVATLICMKRHVKGIYHANYTILLQLYLSTFIVTDVFSIACHTNHLISFIFFSPCDISFDAFTCFIYRHGTHSSVAVMSFVEFFIIFERLIAIKYESDYDKFGIGIGIAFAVASIFFGEGFNLYLVHFAFHLEGSYNFCSPIRLYKGNTYTVFLSTTILLDILSALIILVVFYSYNRTKARQQYNLTIRFENERNHQVLMGLMPTMLSHSVFGIIFFGLQLFLTNYVMIGRDDSSVYVLAVAMNSVPVYTLFAPLLMMYMQKKNSKSFVTNLARADDYFKAYEKMW